MDINGGKNKYNLFLKIKTYFRAIKINYSLDPRFFWMQIINALGNETRPLINAILASIIIDGLYNGKSERTLIIYAILVVSINFIINIEVLFTANRRYIRKSMWYKLASMFFNSFAENMDYEHLENSHIKDIRKKIDQNIRQEKGVSDFWSWYHLISAIAGIIASGFIIANIFIKTSSDYSSGILYWVNSKWALVFFVFINALSFCYNNFSKKSYNEMWQESNRFNVDNWRRAGPTVNYLLNTKFAMDINIYRWDESIKRFVNEAISNQLLFYKHYFSKQCILQCINTIQQVLVKFLICCFLVLKAISGAFGIGSIILYMTSTVQFSTSISMLGNALGNIRGNMRIYEEEFSFLDIKSKMTEGTLTPNMNGNNHFVEFRNVSYCYPGSNTYALHRINCSFNLGEKIAIVGVNGSGKSTFIKLLCRLYDPTEGEIFLDGRNIKEYDYNEYMKIFSVVFQDFKLFAFSLSENIAANKIYDKTRIYACLSKVGLQDFVKKLPNGIDTCLYRNFDSNGIEISGGEAQRISMARALYRDSPIVVLDEPTAALDPITEANIYSSLNDIFDNKTIIFVSHRLSSCRFSDKIIVFNDGQIIQCGSHNDLVTDLNGKYAELWNAQSKYYLN